MDFDWFSMCWVRGILGTCTGNDPRSCMMATEGLPLACHFIPWVSVGPGVKVTYRSGKPWETRSENDRKFPRFAMFDIPEGFNPWWKPRKLGHVQCIRKSSAEKKNMLFPAHIVWRQVQGIHCGFGHHCWSLGRGNAGNAPLGRFSMFFAWIG